MSNRDALRRLTRKIPTPPEIDTIMDDLSKGSDLSVALVATSIVESALEELLKSRFVEKRKPLAGQIFLNRGPLSDFHSKILIAEAMGLVTVPMANELHSLKAIRNAFAHSRMPLTFEHELVTKEIESLRMTSAMKVAGLNFPYKVELSNKSWFLLVTKILLIIMDQTQKHGGSASAAIRDALKEPRASPN